MPNKPLKEYLWIVTGYKPNRAKDFVTGCGSDHVMRTEVEVGTNRGLIVYACNTETGDVERHLPNIRNTK